MNSAPQQMRAAFQEAYGGPEWLLIRVVDCPMPGPGQVLVRVRAASINDWDLGLLKGDELIIRLMNGLFRPKVSILGCDIAGIVEAVGSNVTTWQAGDEVFGDLCACGFGAFAEYACAPEAALFRKPAAMSFEQAAAIPQAGMLAVQGLIDVGDIKSGQKVLLNGAGGGVGTLGLQIAKAHGAEVTAVDSGAKLEMLRALGADHVFDYREFDFTRGGRRYDLILDPKTSRMPWAYVRVLNSGGVYVTVGGDLSRVFAMLALRSIFRGADKRLRLVALKPNKDLAYMCELFEAGKLRPVIDGPFKLEEIADAFRLFEAAGHKGKIIIAVP